MSGIRVTYSGLTSLVFGLASLFLGLGFMLFVTRILSPIEFGTWGLINGLIIYATIIEPVFSYWATRETARGIESGRTNVVWGGTFSIFGIIIYLIVTFLIGQHSDADQNALFFSTILIPLIFLNRILSAISFGWKPHAPMVGGFFFGITEVLLALILIYFLGMGIWGVIITVAVAYGVSIIALFFYAKEKIKNKIKTEFLKKWLKLFWVPLYPAIGYTILLADVTIFSVITGSVIGLAFWGAAMIIAKLVESSSLISRAVYPKLLKGDNQKFLENNIVQLFYFAILFVGIAITFAKPGLFIVNPQYVMVVPVVIILAIQVLFHTIGGMFQTFVTGIEKVDVNTKSTFKDYIKSKLFFIPTLVLIQSIVYVPTLTIGLLIFKTVTDSQTDLLILWASISLLVQIPFTVYSYILLKRNFAIHIDFKSIFKYIVVGIGTFGMSYVVTEQFLVYKISIFEFLPNVLLFVILAVGSYLLITFLIDTRTKNLFISIINEIKSKNL